MISTVDLFMSVISIGVGSYITSKLGARVASVTVYAGVALFVLFVLYGQFLWATTVGFIAMSCFYSMFGTLTSICTNPLRMQLSDPTVAATQFTIYNSLSNLPVTLGATLYAVIGGTTEMTFLIWTMAALAVAGGLTYSTMKAGSRHVAAEPVPEVD
jgi:PAT family beta-lactamase induction signal transducer AmpG